MWYIIFAIVIGTIFLYILVKHGTSANFLTYYRRAIRSGENERDALSGAVNLFRYRKPFDQLTDDDVECFIDEIMKSNNPAMAASALIQKCESACDVSILKKEWIIKEQTKAKI